ncbi:MAG TPA: histidine kinase dimerization/phospho-acceptor domain-containing protein [Candidatus Acidoferrum sp.]|nr:histidine kinase dimerization/phospho-acceptor domain-containing protein [Candidatus Acidoferrum sp.]
MQGAVKKVMQSPKCTVLVGITSAAFPRIAREIEVLVGASLVCFAADFARLREMAARERPRVILLDDRLLVPGPLAESLADFVAVAPVVLIAPYDRQSEVARLIADGGVEFVPRGGEWVPLAASLIERRLRSSEAPKAPLAMLPGRLDPDDIGEIFRHEINNPLTGILGNAELILAHSDRLPAVDTQRIRTVVELAVRLRETVRRLSDAWDARPDSLKSA